MIHGDDKGLVIPPKVAPLQVVIVPIIKKTTDANEILEKAKQLEKSLKSHGI